MTIAEVCILIACLLPIVSAGLAKSKGFGKPRRLGGFDNNDPRQWLANLQGWQARANAAQLNLSLIHILDLACFTWSMVVVEVGVFRLLAMQLSLSQCLTANNSFERDCPTLRSKGRCAIKPRSAPELGRVRQAWRVTSSVKVRWPGFAEPKARRRARASPRGGV